MRAPVVCACGGAMTSERVQLSDGRTRFTLSCDDCWDSLVEYSRRKAVRAIYGGRTVLVGYISVPA